MPLRQCRHALHRNRLAMMGGQAHQITSSDFGVSTGVLGGMLIAFILSMLNALILLINYKLAMLISVLLIIIMCGLAFSFSLSNLTN